MMSIIVVDDTHIDILFVVTRRKNTILLPSKLTKAILNHSILNLQILR